jgi:hypothetical protein
MDAHRWQFLSLCRSYGLSDQDGQFGARTHASRFVIQSRRRACPERSEGTAKELEMRNSG